MNLEQQTIPQQTCAFKTRTLLLFWILSGVILLTFLGRSPVQRTQEARVLETARQMMNQPLRGWMIPTLNEELRLHKPPLTYWLSAVAFHIGGVNEFAGRAPTVIIGWLTIGLVFWIGNWLFNQRTGLLAAAVLASSYFFFRFTRLAETDAPAMLFVTLGVFGLWRGMYEHWSWFYLGALGIGLAGLSKGPPAIFPVLFFFFAVIATQRFSAIWRFIICGAAIVAALIADAWFAYIIHTIGWSTFRSELAVTVEGEDHAGSPLIYIPQLLLATLPWAPVFILALIEAIRRWHNERARLMLVWFLAIALPLCFTGNKQPHYLLPLMPLCALLCGWWLSNNLSSKVRPILAFAIASMLALVIGLGWWYPSTRQDDPRKIAQAIEQRCGDGPYLFFGFDRSLPLCFAMRREIPTVETIADLQKRQQPGTTLICKVRDKEPLLPPGFHEVLDFKAEEHKLEVYRAQ